MKKDIITSQYYISSNFKHQKTSLHGIESDEPVNLITVRNIEVPLDRRTEMYVSLQTLYYNVELRWDLD